MEPTRGLGSFLSFIRFSHTVFALPFALGAMFVAAGGLPPPGVMGVAVLAGVSGRTAAMTFNRLADWEIDKRNPRTEGRHRLASRFLAGLICAVSAVGFVLCAAALNPLCLLLSPVALGLFFFYSFTKRFTHGAQFFLGLALAVAPVGGWVAVSGSFSWAPFVLAGAVLCWVAGFDMIYALQDYAFDLREGLHSAVVWLGPKRTRHIAVLLHCAAFAGLLGFGLVAGLGRVYFLLMIPVCGALVWEHLLAKSGDTHSINRAFFQANAAVGLLFALGTLADQLTSH
jgi:4-hydroxybenzoate polyprenyltransferase